MAETYAQLSQRFGEYMALSEKRISEQADIIADVRAANRRILKLADERAKEANGLRAQLASAKKAIDAMCDHLEAADPFGDNVTRNELKAWRDLLTDDLGGK